jgi:hypothetical protein
MFGQGIGTALLEVYHVMIAHLIARTMIAQDLTGQPYTELIHLCGRQTTATGS